MEWSDQELYLGHADLRCLLAGNWKCQVAIEYVNLKLRGAKPAAFGGKSHETQ